MKRFLIGISGLVIATVIVVADSRAQGPYGDAQAMLEFQRAADAYAFSHRQTERRGAAAAVRIEGAIFTPVVAAAFRTRIAMATGRGDCAVPPASQTDFVVPRVNGSIAGTSDLPGCIAAVLPRLPAELQYRVSGVALVLTDAHLLVVVDVLHAAFPARLALSSSNAIGSTDTNTMPIATSEKFSLMIGTLPNR